MTDITDKLAAALSLTPCTCIWTGSWPRFKAEVKAHPEHVCSRCNALESYHAIKVDEQPVPCHKDSPLTK